MIDNNQLKRIFSPPVALLIFSGCNFFATFSSLEVGGRLILLLRPPLVVHPAPLWRAIQIPPGVNGFCPKYSVGKGMYTEGYKS